MGRAVVATGSPAPGTGPGHSGRTASGTGVLVGFTLVAEGISVHIPKGYIYFSMAFSLFVEMLNLRMSKRKAARAAARAEAREA